MIYVRAATRETGWHIAPDGRSVTLCGLVAPGGKWPVTQQSERPIQDICSRCHDEVAAMPWILLREK
jgi:hypothetical protein